MSRYCSIVLSLALLPGCFLRPAAPPPAGSGEALDLALPSYPGRGQVQLGDLRGKVVLIDFWATWCEPCANASRAFQALYAQFHAQGLEVYGVALDEDPREISAFLELEGVHYPILLDPSAQVSAPRFHIESIPAFLVADRTGRIRFTHAGFSDDVRTQVAQEIQQLLAEPPPARP